MGERTRTIGEGVGTLEREFSAESAVRLVMEGVSREVRKAREASAKEIREFREDIGKALETVEMTSSKAETASEKAVEKAAEASRKDAFADRLRIIGTILLALALCVILMHHETDKAWNRAMNAYQRPSAVIARADQARSDADAALGMRTLPRPGKLHSMAE
jgi:hypothetical protein